MRTAAGPSSTDEAEEVVRRYLVAMGTGDAATVRSLFLDDGVIDDFKGGHRVGGEDIERFMTQRPHRVIDLVGQVLSEGRRFTAYTRMTFDDGRSMLVRFIFTMSGDLIEHLCNSSVEFVPEQYRSPERRLLS